MITSEAYVKYLPSQPGCMSGCLVCGRTCTQPHSFEHCRRSRPHSCEYCGCLWPLMWALQALTAPLAWASHTLVSLLAQALGASIARAMGDWLQVDLTRSCVTGTLGLTCTGNGCSCMCIDVCPSYHFFFPPLTLITSRPPTRKGWGTLLYSPL